MLHFKGLGTRNLGDRVLDDNMLKVSIFDWDFCFLFGCYELLLGYNPQILGAKVVVAANSVVFRLLGVHVGAVVLIWTLAGVLLLDELDV